MQEFPALQQIHESFQSKGLQVIALTNDDPEAIGRVKQSKNVTFTILRDPEGKTMELYGVSGIPRTLIIDKDGVVQVDIEGGEELDQFKEKLKKVGL